eukprot:gene6203-6918_t
MENATRLRVHAFIIVLQYFIQLSAGRSNCANGEIYVHCIWNQTICSNFLRPKPSRPSAFLPPQKDDNLTASILLYQEQRMIGRHETVSGLFSHGFSVNFDSLLSAHSNYTCVWKDNSGSDICRVSVTDRKVLRPHGHLENVKLLVYNHQKFRSSARALKLQYNFHDSLVVTSRNFSFFATVQKYRYDVHKCPVSVNDAVTYTEELSRCQNNSGMVVCPGLLKWMVTPAVYTVDVVVKNSFGSCKGRIFCQWLGFYDKYGQIKDLTVNNVFPIGLNVSWIYPDYLMKVVSSPVIFTIRICTLTRNISCQLRQMKRQRTDNSGSSCQLIEDIQHNTNYSIALQYIVTGLWKPEKAPWTKEVFITTPNSIPDKLPEFIQCQAAVKVLVISWKQHNKNVGYYHVVIKDQNQSKGQSFKTFNCTNSVCEFSHERKNQGSLYYDVYLSACSNGGCGKAVTLRCDFDKIHRSKKPPSSVGLSSGLIVVIVVLPLLLLAFGVAIVAKIIHKRKHPQTDHTSETNIEFVNPRQSENNGHYNEPESEGIYDNNALTS